LSDLTPRQSNRPTRRRREQRAYALTLAAGGAALITLIAVVLAVVGVTGFGTAIVFAIVTALLAYQLRRTLNP
jgi:hypothetical protein